MGQTSAGVTWPVWTRAGAWDMTVAMSSVSTRNVANTYRPGYGLYTISVM